MRPDRRYRMVVVAAEVRKQAATRALQSGGVAAIEAAAKRSRLAQLSSNAKAMLGLESKRRSRVLVGDGNR